MRGNGVPDEVERIVVPRHIRGPFDYRVILCKSNKPSQARGTHAKENQMHVSG